MIKNVCDKTGQKLSAPGANMGQTLRHPVVSSPAWRRRRRHEANMTQSVVFVIKWSPFCGRLFRDAHRDFFTFEMTIPWNDNDISTNKLSERLIHEYYSTHLQEHIAIINISLYKIFMMLQSIKQRQSSSSWHCYILCYIKKIKHLSWSWGCPLSNKLWYTKLA